MTKFNRKKMKGAPVDTSMRGIFPTDEELLKKATVARLLKNYRKIKAIPEAVGRNNVKKPFSKSSDGKFTLSTIADARAEDLKRAKAHKESEASFPPYLLHNAEEDKLVGTLASARFMRWVNDKVSGQTLPVVRKALRASEVGAVHATLIGRDGIIHVDDIDSIDFRMLKQQLSQNLQRAGVTAADGILVGAWDADLRGEWLRIHPHCIVTGEKVKAMEKLRDLTCYKHCPGNPKPVVLKVIKDPRTQVAYCIKTYWGQGSYSVDEDGSTTKQAKGRRMPKDIERACLEKLHNTPLSDYLILNGVRLGAKGLVRTLGRSGKK